MKESRGTLINVKKLLSEGGFISLKDPSQNDNNLSRKHLFSISRLLWDRKNSNLSLTGFTLVETMMVAAILPIIFVALFSVMALANTIFQTNTVYARLNESAMQTFRYISREIGESSPLANPARVNIATDANGNSILRFQIPVDYDNDGDVVTSALNPQVEWGVYNNVGDQTVGVQNGWARYQVTNNQLIRDALDSALVSIANTSRIVSNNVQTFTIAQNGDTVTMNLGLSATDDIGQNGQARTHTWTFTSNTILRNAVN